MEKADLTAKERIAKLHSIKEGEGFEPETIEHREILDRLLNEVEATGDFKKLARQYGYNIPEGEDARKVYKREKVVLSVQHTLETAQNKDWGMAQRFDSVYLYNGAYWSRSDKEDVRYFLGNVAEKIGVNGLAAKYYQFKKALLDQFMADAYLKAPQTGKDLILINLLNGTAEIDPNSSKLINLRPPKREDFLTYQLNFDYDPKATAPRFKKYLNEVLPDKKLQKILAEFIGYVFVDNSFLKLEKALILHGGGQNGKSVFFDIINALLGKENVSNYSLESLTNSDRGYHRAKIADKLLNYGSDISTNIDTALFKQLISGESMEARLPYGQPFIMNNYAKMVFNANELPTDVEHTKAFFRRFLIIPFDVTIPENKKDPQLAKKIITGELSGVFNWVLDGLKRVLKQRGFTHSEKAQRCIDRFKTESDSVLMFLESRGFVKSHQGYTPMTELYGKYTSFCAADGYRPVGKINFGKRLESAGYIKDKKQNRVVFYVTQD